MIPPHVDHTLTPLGVEVAKQVRGLFDWINGGMPAITSAQRTYDSSRGQAGTSPTECDASLQTSYLGSIK